MSNYSLFLSALGRARRTKDDVFILDNNLNSVSSAVSTLQLEVNSISSAVSTLQINDEAIRQAAGLTINFGYPVFSGTNSLDGTTSITDALLALDNSIRPTSVDGGFASTVYNVQDNFYDCGSAVQTIGANSNLFDGGNA